MKHAGAHASRAENVIDLEAFRRERTKVRAAADEGPMSMHAGAVMVPVWFCWVPVWAPMHSL